jgi:hypothetical protein
MKKLTVKSQDREVKFYTIGQIFRLGLLKNNKGEAYKDKASVSNVLKTYEATEKKTPFGMSRMFPDTLIAKLNSRWQ